MQRSQQRVVPRVWVWFEPHILHQRYRWEEGALLCVRMLVRCSPQSKCARKLSVMWPTLTSDVQLSKASMQLVFELFGFCSQPLFLEAKRNLRLFLATCVWLCWLSFKFNLQASCECFLFPCSMVTIMGDLQPGCLADWMLTGFGQPQNNPWAQNRKRKSLVFCWERKLLTSWLLT